MNQVLNYLLVLGGVVAAGAVAGMCLVVLLVWFAGRTQKDRREAWRQADEA